MTYEPMATTVVALVFLIAATWLLRLREGDFPVGSLAFAMAMLIAGVVAGAFDWQVAQLVIWAIPSVLVGLAILVMTVKRLRRRQPD